MNGVMNILREPMLERLGWTLVHSVWECAAAAILLAVALTILRQSNARYLAACGALMVCALVPAGTFFLLAPTQPSSIPSGNGHVISIDPPAAVNSPAVVLAVRPIHIDPLDIALPVAGLLWAVGVVILSMRQLGGWMSLRRLRRESRSITDTDLVRRMDDLIHRMNVRRPVILAESLLVQVPSLIGWLRPMVLIPCSALTGLNPLHLQALLAHELAHVRRNDYLVNLVQTAIETLLFYHPMVWWISRQIRHEREHCCDDLAVAIVGDARAYGAALAAMEQLRSPGDLAMASSGGSLLKRIQRLVKPEPRRSMFWPALMMIAIITGAVAFAQVATPETQAQTQPPASQPAAFDPASYVNATAEELMQLSPEQRRAVMAEKNRRTANRPQRPPATTQSAAPASDVELKLGYDQLRDISRALTEATLKRIEAEQTYGNPNHTAVRRARSIEAALAATYQERLVELSQRSQLEQVALSAPATMPTAETADLAEVMKAIRQAFGYRETETADPKDIEQLHNRLAVRIAEVNASIAEKRKGDYTWEEMHKDQAVLETLKKNMAEIDSRVLAMQQEGPTNRETRNSNATSGTPAATPAREITPNDIVLQRQQSPERAVLEHEERTLTAQIQQARAQSGNENAVKAINDRLAQVRVQLQDFDNETKIKVAALTEPAPSYYISGVSRSGMYSIGMNGVSLTGALLRANNNTSIDPAKFIAIIHQTPREGPPSHVFAAHDLESAGELSIQPGDVIMVTDKGTLPLPLEKRYTIAVGQTKPVVYPLQRNMTLLQAVVSAGVNPPELEGDWRVLLRRTSGDVPQAFKQGPFGIAVTDLMGGEIGMTKIVGGDVITIQTAAELQAPR